MHEVVPRVVAMAVRMVMAMCRIFCQIDFVSIVSRLVLVVSFGGWWVFLSSRGASFLFVIQSEAKTSC